MLKLQLSSRLLRTLESFSGKSIQVFLSDFVLVDPVCKTCSFAQQARAMALANMASSQVRPQYCLFFVVQHVSGSRTMQRTRKSC